MSRKEKQVIRQSRGKNSFPFVTVGRTGYKRQPHKEDTEEILGNRKPRYNSMSHL